MMRQIKDELQEIAKTIKAVIGIDITVMDKKPLRIAVTGKFKAKIAMKNIFIPCNDESM